LPILSSSRQIVTQPIAADTKVVGNKNTSTGIKRNAKEKDVHMIQEGNKEWWESLVMLVVVLFSLDESCLGFDRF